jgi:hypothetical protein
LGVGMADNNGMLAGLAKETVSVTQIEKKT